MNNITVRTQPDGTQLWLNRDEATGEAIRYVFVPKAQLLATDRVENMRGFERNGNDLRTKNETGFSLSAGFISGLPNGSFLRMREAP